MDSEKIKDKVANLLRSGKIKSFVGYSKGTNPFFHRPFITSSEKGVRNAVFSVLCVNNLTRYIVDDYKKALKKGEKRDARPIGLVVKGCDSRALNVLLQENFISRTDVFLIGMPCNGVIDPKKAERNKRSGKAQDRY